MVDAGAAVMSDFLSDAKPAAPELPQRPTAVFLSWSGDDSRDLSRALRALLIAVFGEQGITPFHSTDMPGSEPWREQIQKAVIRSDAAVLSLVPASLASTWLMYEAGAFFTKGRVYLLACGIDVPALQGTPLDAYHLRDARNQDDVKRLTHSLGGVGPGNARAFEDRFASAWPAFSTVVERIHCGQEIAREAARAAVRRRAQRIWWLGLAAAPALLALLVCGLLGWSSWPRPLCPFVDSATCVDYRWENFVARASTEQNPNLDKKISRRPFAVVAIGTSCDSAPGAPQLVSPKDKVTSASIPIPIAYSRSSWDKPDPVADKQESAIVVGDEDGASMITVATGCREIRGNAIHVRYVDTLSDDKLCEKARAIRPHFRSRDDLGAALTRLLMTFYVDGKAPAPPPLGEWLAQCGIQDPPATKKATS